ncbi:MAG: amidohydrolase [Longimonas sp.]|uniref:amidohydrolase n=1 Tax=Longimonas sp. TaxID=2039626 RepID=UPI0033443B8B
MSSWIPSDPAHLPDVLRDVLEQDTSLASLLIGIRRHLHRNPEVGMNEHATSRFISKTLQAYGMTVRGPVAGTGLFVDIGPKDPTQPIVAYRADIDALPTQDQKHDVPYRSQRQGVAHLCGHDAHTAMGIGIALALQRRKDELPGRVRVFFQPNEEGLPSGAPLMIDAGVLDGVGAVYAVHVDPSLSVGRYGLIAGAATASSDRFDVHVRQDGSGHSARPQEGIDTVWVAHQVMNAFYQLSGRITDARNPAVLTVCKLDGSQAHNVIPERASFGGTLRTTQPDDRARLRDKMEDLTQLWSTQTGASIELDFEDGSPPVMNDPMLIEHTADTISDEFGPQAVHRIAQNSMGGEDFAHYLKHVPGAFVRVGTASGPATKYPLHHQCFDIDETALLPTVRLMRTVLVRHLERNLSKDRVPTQPPGMTPA